MDLKQVEEALAHFIRYQTFPVALKLCQSEGELPEKARMPVRDLGHQVTLCQAIGLTRRFGWTLAVGRDDQSCLGGALTMGFVAGSPQSFPFPDEKRLEAGKYSHLLMAPIGSATFEPDVVVVYGSSAQVMRLSHAAAMGGGLQVSARGTGLADCGDVVTLTAHSGQCQFILPSGGDRVFGSTQDHEVIFAIPANQGETIAAGLASTHKMGFRYPVLTDLHHSPALPPFLKIPKDD